MFSHLPNFSLWILLEYLFLIDKEAKHPQTQQASRYTLDKQYLNIRILIQVQLEDIHFVWTWIISDCKSWENADKNTAKPQRRIHTDIIVEIWV